MQSLGNKSTLTWLAQHAHKYQEAMQQRKALVALVGAATPGQPFQLPRQVLGTFRYELLV